MKTLFGFIAFLVALSCPAFGQASQYDVAPAQQQHPLNADDPTTPHSALAIYQRFKDAPESDFIVDDEQLSPRKDFLIQHCTFNYQDSHDYLYFHCLRLVDKHNPTHKKILFLYQREANVFVSSNQKRIIIGFTAGSTQSSVILFEKQGTGLLDYVNHGDFELANSLELAFAKENHLLPEAELAKWEKVVKRVHARWFPAEDYPELRYYLHETLKFIDWLDHDSKAVFKLTGGNGPWDNCNGWYLVYDFKTNKVIPDARYPNDPQSVTRPDDAVESAKKK